MKLVFRNTNSLRSPSMVSTQGSRAEIARNSVESRRPSELIGYATAAPFANGFLETAFAIEDSSNGICR